METRKQILTELQEIAPILGKNEFTRLPYSVPAGYFGHFADLLMIRIRLESADFSAASSQEIGEISPLLAELKDKNPYRVPEGFFETLQVKIPASEPSKLVAMPIVSKETNADFFPRKRGISLPLRLIRYAAAACIVALIGITAFNITFHHNIMDPIVGLANVSDQDMANYLDADDIHWTPGVTSVNETASAEFSDNDIHDLLSSVPDDELEQYSNALQVQKGTVN